MDLSLVEISVYGLRRVTTTLKLKGGRYTHGLLLDMFEDSL